MPCTNCNETPINIPIVPAIYTTSCIETPSAINAKDYVYLGANLPCSAIFSGNNLETVIQKLDSKLCGVLGDFSTYNTGCLTTAAGNPILTQQEFVEASSKEICKIKDDFNEFVELTYEGYKEIVNNRFKLIEIPGTISTTLGITSTSTLQNTLNVLTSTLDNILNVKLNLSSVVWNNCFVVSPIPTTLSGGFNTVLSQICSLKNSLGAGGLILPTFNNVGSCLASPLTSADSLVDTVNKIKAKVCATPTFDINDLTWGCTAKPSSVASDLQSAFQTVLNTTNDYKQNKITFSSDFELTNTGDACGGKTVHLAIPSSSDRYVAINTSDTTPGTLSSKFTAGAGITLDTISVPGTMVISSSASSTDTKVKTEVTDPSSGYLEDKIQVSTNSAGVSVTKATDLSTHKVALGTSVNGAALWTFLLDFLDANPTTYAQFCERVNNCLPDCIIPPNVTVIYDIPVSTTTTTTTTIP